MPCHSCNTEVLRPMHMTIHLAENATCKFQQIPLPGHLIVGDMGTYGFDQKFFLCSVLRTATNRTVSLSEARDSEKPFVVKMVKGADSRCSIVDGIDFTSDWGYESINTKWATPLIGPVKSAFKLLHSAFIDNQDTDIKQASIIDKFPFKDEDRHFVFTNFMSFLMTESSPEACFISIAVTGILPIEPAGMQYTSFFRDMLPMKVS
ncbi:hypothetical protein ACTXT7_006158 [Hymenolepis weldensis]